MTAIDSSLEDFDDEIDDAMDSEALDRFAYALNDDHFIRFARRGPSLLVTFDVVHDPEVELSACHARLDPLAREMEWSTLSLTSRGHTWFRAPEVVNFFDALVDGTLLDQFSEVLFYGASSGAHAALSYALTAPLCRVMALSPQAALGPAVPWDSRFTPPEGIDFAGRYAPTAENLETADTVYLPFDPTTPEDARHAGLLASGATLPLSCRHMGAGIEDNLIRLGVLDDIVAEAMGGTLDAATFYTALRARRDDPAYLRRLVSRLIDAGRPLFEALVVRNVAERTGRNRYARRFEKLQEQLAKRGVRIPASRRPG